jgi:hypothetical protein
MWVSSEGVALGFDGGGFQPLTTQSIIVRADIFQGFRPTV